MESRLCFPRNNKVHSVGKGGRCRVSVFMCVWRGGGVSPQPAALSLRSQEETGCTPSSRGDEMHPE